MREENEEKESIQANVRSDFILTNHNSVLSSCVSLPQVFKNLLTNFSLHTPLSKDNSICVREVSGKLKFLHKNKKVTTRRHTF
ncbi:hypothetical protein E1A91_A11G235700v1 [Gossypium mustelinum]|uniref:Uncharacterized protein n=1 Tax=Gossypium mustelinum TaxID=34275 RepID=A0A5D2XAS8_GOSMU|nr:hypothetical protein E1A91_A11G235700v1 [Gossypium mustelinum]